VLLQTAQTSAVEPPITPDKIHSSQDLDQPGPVLGRETWVLTKKKKIQLLVFERKVLQTICGPKIENDVYKRRNNHGRDKEFHSPNAVNVTNTSRLRFAGHIIRKSEDSKTYHKKLCS
jgi:hypothetical protein